MVFSEKTRDECVQVRCATRFTGSQFIKINIASCNKFESGISDINNILHCNNYSLLASYIEMDTLNHSDPVRVSLFWKFPGSFPLISIIQVVTSQCSYCK